MIVGVNPAGGIECDVAIVGCGVAGLFAALNLPLDLDVVMLSKGAFEECDSMLAQGGICVQRDEADYGDFYEDTMRAGRYENDPKSVDVMIRESRDVIDDLVALGVRFDREPDGSLSYTREAAHSRARICHCADATGKEITERLFEAASLLPNVRMLEHATMVDLICSEGRCEGLVAIDHRGDSFAVSAACTILATGGVGGLYERSTNYSLLTGDGIRLAGQYGAELAHIDWVQIHPTSLYKRESGRAFLISESARGEGAVLLNACGRRFTDELAPRDVVSAAIHEQMAEERSAHVWLSFQEMDSAHVAKRFPNIYRRCLDEGYDITCEPIPVVPAQHYLMGGIAVDLDSCTSMEGLFAVGECSWNGVHGKNRLASNSLLESLVFARRAARRIARLSLPSDLG